MMKKRELSPLADPVFKRVFGEEKEILMELINAVMELPHPVVNIEYIPPELLSENIDRKTTIVDVRCTDDQNRHFIVEMQPLYALCLADHVIEPETDRWKHKYVFINEDEPWRRIHEVEMHFIELSKCRKRGNFNLEDPLDRWVKYLIDPAFIKALTMDTQYNYPNLKKAVELLDESNYTEGQLLAYDRYLDSIRSWNSSMKLSYEEGIEEGIEKMKKNLESALTDLKAEISIEEVATKYDLELAYVDMLYRQFIEK